VELVRPRLGLHRDHARDRLSELRVVILRGDLRLADGLQVRIYDDDAKNRVAIFGPVELIPGATEVLAVDHRLRRPLRVLARGVAPTELRGSGREQDELREVPIENGQVGQLLRLERRSHVRSVRLERLALTGRDRHCLGDRARLERDVEVRRRIDVHDDAREQRLFEAGRLDLNVVGARKQSLLRIQARLVRRDLSGCLPFGARDRYGRIRDDRAARVRYGPRDAAVHGLRASVAREPSDQKQAKNEH